MDHITHINEEGLELIKSFESFVNHPYPDPATGKMPYTIGYGTTIYPNGIRVSLSDPNITEKQASDLLLANLKHYEEGIDSLTTDNLTSNQFSALVSWVYNLGLNNLKSSSLLKLINSNPSDPLIKNEWLKWCYANGHKMDGLLRRREAEFALYCK